MAGKELSLLLTQSEIAMLDKALQIHQAMYERKGKAQPEFADVANRYADELNALELKIKAQAQTLK